MGEWGGGAAWGCVGRGWEVLLSIERRWSLRRSSTNKKMCEHAAATTKRLHPNVCAPLARGCAVQRDGLWSVAAMRQRSRGSVSSSLNVVESMSLILAQV